MPKDRLILLLLLTVFVLLGADCQAPWEDDDEKERPLPDRALASSSLVRAYYNSRTFPEEMRSIKIPENGSNAQDDDDELTIEFGMGSATVTDMRVHWYIVPPAGKSLDDVELLTRLIAPNGTASSWKVLDTGLVSAVYPQHEIDFQFEFDGIDSAGTWRAQIRDHVNDDDGRCLFRNASLHVNLGLSGVGGAANETNSVTAATGNYGTLLEASGQRTEFDLGWIGTHRMLGNDFTVTSSFEVTMATISISVYTNSGASSSTDVVLMLVSPSGNWHAERLPVTQTGSIDLVDGRTLTSHDVIFQSFNALTMNLNGEPSAGTWTVYVADIIKDGNTIRLTPDQPGASAVVPDGANLTLRLDGLS